MQNNNCASVLKPAVQINKPEYMFLEKNSQKKKKLKKKWFRSNLYTLIVIFMLVLLALLSFCIALIGYHNFTKYFTNEYNDSVLKTAVTASYLVDGSRIPYYMEHGKDSEDYQETEYLLTRLCNSEGMSVIYVMTISDDYKMTTSVFNCLNDESTYTKWELGYQVKTSDVEYEKAYRKMYEEGLESATVVRIENLNSGKPHVTALVPLKDENGNVTAILHVQRYVTELNSIRRKYLNQLGVTAVILMLFSALVAAIFLRKEVVDPIKKISQEAERFAKDNSRNPKGVGAEISHVREISSLACSIDKMEYDTLKYVEDITNMTKESERIGTELNVASNIQLGLLPSDFPAFPDKPEFEIYASMTPAKEVGGDFYDFFLIDDDHLAFLIADVSDKGIGAAFFMAIAKTIIKTRALTGASPAEILAAADSIISKKNPAGMFVTVWLAVLNLKTGHVVACNAGHDYPAILQRKGQEGFVIEKTDHGPPVAFLPDMTFPNLEFDLRPGDRLFLYTDGLNEAKSVSGERFGVQRILDVLNEHTEDNEENTLKAMEKAVRTFSGEEPQFDDMTMLGLTYKGRTE